MTRALLGIVPNARHRYVHGYIEDRDEPVRYSMGTVQLGQRTSAPKLLAVRFAVPDNDMTGFAVYVAQDVLQHLTNRIHQGLDSHSVIARAPKCFRTYSTSSCASACPLIARSIFRDSIPFIIRNPFICIPVRYLGRVHLTFRRDFSVMRF